MLEIKELTYHIHQKQLLAQFSHQFCSGFLYGILGPNGSGKSTLLKSIAAIWKPSAGEILWKGSPLHEKSRLDISRIVTFVPQQPRSQFDFTVFELVKMGCYVHEKGKQSDELVKDSLQAVGAWHLEHRRLTNLSGGEVQRIYLARALATQCPILLLDEPTAHLDIRHQLEILDLLKTLVGNNRTIITSQHDLHLARRYCDQLILLSDGQCRVSGTPDEVLTDQWLGKVFGIQFRNQQFELSK